jgi:hypothetical protein
MGETMKRLLMAVLAGLMISGPAWGYDEVDEFKIGRIHNLPECGEYLGAYDKATLTAEHTYQAPYEAWGVFEWINGYVTAYNLFVDTGVMDVLSPMAKNDSRRWIASWCRDNPSSDLDEALQALCPTLQ